MLADMTLTPADVAAGTRYIDPDELTVGHVIDFFGEPHKIEAFVNIAGPLVDAGLVPGGRIAVADGGTWQLTLPTTLVPVRAVA